MLEQTLTSNTKVRINPQYPVIAGVDKDQVPRLLRSDADGRLDIGGVTLPTWDTAAVAYVSATNNIHTVIYSLLGVEVARWTFTYVAAGAADNDRVATAVFAKP